MAVLDELGYTTGSANAPQRVMQKVAASGPGSWVFQRTLYPIDKALFGLTGGRVTVPSLVAGLPVILLTTTGAKTGRSRTMPLAGVPMGEDLAIIGSNYGQRPTPGWVYNLEANPAATVAYRDRSVAVVARPADDEEADRVFEQAADVYPGYNTYRDRAAHRTIRVFLLESSP
ncbi:MAG: nitroreductase family deazaflavin-dependent oxidoreductase [Actinomycetota bacterium]